MQNRVVSLASLLASVASVVFFLASFWGVMSQRMAEGDGVLAMGGWLVAALFFAYRHEDPQWLDPVSIVKSR